MAPEAIKDKSALPELAAPHSIQPTRRAPQPEGRAPMFVRNGIGTAKLLGPPCFNQTQVAPRDPLPVSVIHG